MRKSVSLSLGFLGLCFGGVAEGGIVEWEAAVGSGSVAGYVNTGITSPIVDDIGMYDDGTNGGVTYEFFVNAVNFDQSNTLMGTSESSVGDNGALKWQQYRFAGNFGLSDYRGVHYNHQATSNGAYQNVDTHLVFVSDGVNTTLYLNGELDSVIPDTLALSGVVGIGQINSSGFDRFSGTIYGVAVYDSALNAGEILEHATAAFVPEPASLGLILLGAGFVMGRRK